MTVTDVLRAVRARWVLFLVCLVVPIGAAFVNLNYSGRVYESTAELYVAPNGANTTDTPGGTLYAHEGAVLAQVQAPDYARLANSRAVMTSVISDLKLATTPSTLAGQVSGSSSQNSAIIYVTARASTAIQARDIANAAAAGLTTTAEKVSVQGPKGGVPVRLILVKPAAQQASPVSPKPAADVAVGIAVGIVLAFTVVILREKANARVRTVEQARSISECDAVTAIRRHPWTGAHRRATADLTVAESFRRLRLTLASPPHAGNGRSTAVACLVPGDPSAAVAVNVAVALAENGSTVALVDADLRSSQIGGLLNIDRPVGLPAVLGGQTPVESALYRYNERLLVLTGGPPRTGSPAAVPGAAVREILRNAGRLADHFVLHVGPILNHAGDAELCSQAQAVVLAVRKNRARQRDLRLATEMLRSAGAHLEAVVLVPRDVKPMTLEHQMPTSAPSVRVRG